MKNNIWGIKPAKKGKKYKPLSIKAPKRSKNKLNVSSWSLKNPKSKKQLSYPQARKKFKLNPFGDRDGDKVSNFLDCRPLNKKKHMAWKANDLMFHSGTFGGKEREPAYKRRVVMMSPHDALKRQYQMRPKDNTKESESHYEDWKKTHRDEAYLKRMQKDIVSKKRRVPMIVEEYTPKGERKDLQEGRHRAAMAIKAGLSQIPVLQVRKKVPPWDRRSEGEEFKYKKAGYLPENEDEDDGYTDWDNIEKDYEGSIEDYDEEKYQEEDET